VAKCPSLEFFIDHYKYFEINKIKVKSEFSSTKALLEHKHIFRPDLEMIVYVLIELPSSFSETLKLMHIIKTLTISTASNEHFFFSMKNVKSYILRTHYTSMGDERLSDLMIINVEKDEANKIDLNKTVDDFGKMKNRRYPLF